MFTRKGGDPEHTHLIEVDGGGTGCTADTSPETKPHTHEIKDWIVEPSESYGIDDHIHDIDSAHITGYKEPHRPKISSKEDTTEKPAAEAAGDTVKISVEVSRKNSYDEKEKDSKEVRRPKRAGASRSNG